MFRDGDLVILKPLGPKNIYRQNEYGEPGVPAVRDYFVGQVGKIKSIYDDPWIDDSKLFAVEFETVTVPGYPYNVLSLYSEDLELVFTI
jgi:hypothetical protein